jgi:glucokinase
MSRKLAIGIDLGGTKVAAGVYDETGARIGELEKLPAAADKPAEKTRDNLFEAVRRAMASADVAVKDLVGIGIGAPGPLDPREGIILHTPNLPHLRGYPLVDIVAKEFETIVVLSNDGNCFALAESTFGRGRGHSIINGQILEGPRACAAEVFLAEVNGLSYDDVVSGTGLRRLWQEMVGGEIEGAEITRRADDGDQEALAVFDAFADVAALGLGNFAALLDPGVVVVGGSVASAWRHFGDRLGKGLRRYVASPACDEIMICATELGAGAGAAGAAALLFTGGRLA